MKTYGIVVNGRERDEKEKAKDFRCSERGRALMPVCSYCSRHRPIAERNSSGPEQAGLAPAEPRRNNNRICL